MQPNSHMLQKPELRHADVCTFSQIMKIKAIALGAKTSQERLKKKCALTLTQKSLIHFIDTALCFVIWISVPSTQNAALQTYS